MQKFNSITKYVLYYYAKFFYVIIGYLFVLLALLVSLQYRVFDIFYGELNYTLFLSKPELFIVIALILFATAIQSFFTTMLIFSIRKELQEGYRKRKLLKFTKHTWQIFVVNLILNYVLYVIYLLLIGLKIGFLLPFVYLIIGYLLCL
jgi:K+-sensing histidine kinase KdpD